MKVSQNQHIRLVILAFFCVLGLPFPVFCQQMFYKATEVIQDSTLTFQGNEYARILKIKIITKGSSNPINVKNLYFSTKGTTNTADISNAKLIYTYSQDVYAQPFSSNNS